MVVAFGELMETVVPKARGAFFAVLSGVPVVARDLTNET